MPSNYRRARNARARADNRIKDLKNTLKSTTNEHIRNEIRKDIRRIQRAVRETRTYSTKTGKQIHNSKQVARGIDKLSRLLEEFPLRVPTQKNRSFQIRMNLASSQALQGPTQEGTKSLTDLATGLTKEEVSVFYRATQRAWNKPNVPIDKRNEAIMKYYKVRDLEVLFNKVLSMERNQNVIKAQEIANNPDDYTEAEKKWAYEIIQDNDDEFRYIPVVTGAVTQNVSPVAPM